MSISGFLKAFVLVVLTASAAYSQCNITTSVTWVNTTTPSCQNNAILQIGSTGTLTFDDNSDTYGVENSSTIYVSGVLNLNGNVTIKADIVVQSGGVVNINGNVTLYGSVTVNSNGSLEINDQLALTATSNCNRSFTVQPGPPAGRLRMNASNSSEKLRICGNEIFRSGTSGGCGAFPSGSPPYCAGSSPFVNGDVTPQNGNPLTLIPGGILPVELLYFNAKGLENEVELSWATSMEENFREFIIQRSQNGVDFEDIAAVPGQGKDVFNIVSKYSYTDKSPMLGFNYYRLKAVDIDEKFEIFEVKVARITGAKRLVIHPNPVTGSIISYFTNFSASEGDRVIIVDAFGKELLNIPASQNQITLSEKFKAGVYILKYVSRDFSEATRLVVKG